ncbi:NAD(P)HX epimerase / NAD(P)HX dehydratase [Pseudonocardia sp. Ae406_Ps2]|uniref:NAD(P)H-hydrate dehydratase n=1 Tax=unclassified Pseudonocardia TaxID=2619320 RepID=UPI00094A9EA8|nr:MULTISPECIES: NAD(P)H-hydrate dehydratase [unclassified Pseudonocardia]OLL97592.1 NAD(P)HX epimerase / NAD(P)HX dehydratase [Pseudonocardia sp. Ae331_Ps2]OLM04692.1 NAD(P)HX epimerase / NAD(P)HX dehydratase [Pseudonocardia sp. Ae406_Ps2]OLM26259.1 NAD(P)HX epimerase / NAD(P)HX dehydratase [Pseudonocardia sp. Ae706_Ps2]OLM33637.1 NAD(P)HX epimerase / NAD(P)HX dehydratase [Pseudonocardia sp. Ae717_Ps2]
MHALHTADQVRAAEAAMMRTVGDGVLMRRAAAGLAHHVGEFLGSTYGRRVVLLVGAGDNGGDALWAGAGLRRRGAHVTAVLLAPDRAHPEGLAALRRARGRVLALTPSAPAADPGGTGAGTPVAAGAGGLDAARALVAGADVVVDGIVGISGRGALRDPAPELVAAADGAGVPIVACDLPSGVDGDTGATDGPHVRAALTVTFGTRKPVHALAAPLCGPVRLVDFGLGPFLEGVEPHARVLSDADVGDRWPVPGPDDDKYSQGVVGIAAGSATYPGAAVLAAGAAALATSGMVRFAGSAADEVRRHWPEIVATGDITDAGRTQAWAVGPGLGTGGQGLAVLEEALGREVPLCLDADAITLLAQHAHLRDRIHGEPVVLTPHAGEFARIAGEVGPDRIGAARRAAADLGVTVLLKGNATVVAAPDGRVLVDPAADSWAATAGSGDVLTGMIGALLAAGLDPWWAAGCATLVHARAATAAAREHGLPPVPAPASAMQAAIPVALRAVRAAAAPY